MGNQGFEGADALGELRLGDAAVESDEGLVLRGEQGVGCLPVVDELPCHGEISVWPGDGHGILWSF